ncbi:NYN domain-containing protein [candidate division KSB1 bacterium]|nr:NYN domain-containing protein [candidate division KSB1 bacterium]MBL7095461.1 NYN domain-containing protein [candidate division KSB1 bacterium]
MNRIAFFFDGFNLFHALDNNHSYHKYKWLDLVKLSSCFVTKKDKIENIYYFTALATWSQSKMKKHKTYIKALELKNIKTIYGEFRKNEKFCPLCKRTYKTFEEKQTDVNIAIQLFELAFQDKYDTAIIISGDSDLIPSIQAVKTTFPNKNIGIVIPIGRRAELLKQTCDFHIKMKEKHLRPNIFKKEIDIGNNKKLICPPEWQ